MSLNQSINQSNIRLLINIESGLLAVPPCLLNTMGMTPR